MGCWDRCEDLVNCSTRVGCTLLIFPFSLDAFYFLVHCNCISHMYTVLLVSFISLVNCNRRRTSDTPGMGTWGTVYRHVRVTDSSHGSIWISSLLPL